MSEKNTAEPVMLSIDVDTSGLQDALVMLERVSAAAKEVQGALAALGLDVVPAPSIASYALGELHQDATSALILAELKSLRTAIDRPRVMGRVGGMRVRK